MRITETAKKRNVVGDGDGDGLELDNFHPQTSCLAEQLQVCNFFVITIQP